MNLPIHASYQWSQDEFVRAQVLSVRSSPAARNFFRTILMIGLLIWVIGICIFFATESSWYELFFPVIFGGVFVFFPWFVQQWARKLYANKADRDMTVNWEVYDDRVVSKTGRASNSTSWTRIQRIIQVREGFLLYPKEEAFQWLPIQAFHGAEGAAQFAELAQSKVKEFILVV